ncbi:MAG TPA: DUF1559 domain-containing protein [Urbifossiella sp.]|nr:DUF1559 domain-containing protein [Urbifossiella sp.]
MRMPSPRSGRAAIALLVGLLVGGWLGGGLVWVLNRHKYRDPGVVADVALARAEEVELVPADAAGFAHIRVTDLWHTDAMSEFRKVLEKAGPDAAKALDDGFVPAPSTLERATVFVLPHPPNDPGPLPAIGILAFSTPFDSAKVREANMPAAEEKTAGSKKYWVDRKRDLAVSFPSDRVILLGSGSSMGRYLAKEPAREGALAASIQLAASGSRHLVASAATNQLPFLMQGMVRGAAPALLSAQALTLGAVFGSGAKIDLRASYGSGQSAEEAEKALRLMAENGRKQLVEFKAKSEQAVNGTGKKPRPITELPEAVSGLFGMGGAKMIDDWLADPPLVRDGKELSATITINSMNGASVQLTAMSIGLLLPAVQKVREAAGRSQDSNNLKMLGLALQSYHDAYGSYPKAGGMDASRKGNLSWRVAILPFMEQEALYVRFRLDEPWDSPTNKALIPLMPKVFANPQAPAEPGRTYCKVFVGPETVFDPKKPKITLSSIADGTSNTIMIAEGGDPVIWTKPDDFAFDPGKPLPNVWLPGQPGINVTLADGSVQYLPRTTSEKGLKNGIVMNDGLPLGP